MASQLPPAELPFDLEAAVAAERLQRAAIAASYLGLVTELGKLIDRLGDLHADLDADDALQQSLHAVGFVWQYFEQELRIVAHGRN